MLVAVPLGLLWIGAGTECYCSSHNLRALGPRAGFAASRTHFAIHSSTAAVVLVAHSYAVEIEAEDSQ